MWSQGPRHCQGTTPSGHYAATSPVQGEATALSKEMGSGKYALKDAVLEKAKGEVFGHSFPYERRLKRRPEIKER